MQIGWSFSLAFTLLGASAIAAEPERRHVLFISVDDLRPALGAYGESAASTPHIDALAKSGVVFTSAFCQYTVCNPSRASFLSGLRPTTTGLRRQDQSFREQLPDVVTLPQHFKDHGYHTASFGKVFHLKEQDERSWSEPCWWATGTSGNSRAWRPSDLPDSALRDGQVADQAIEFLKKRKGSQPFFLALGFYKPHLPLVVPRRFFDNVRLEPASTEPPSASGIPPIAFHKNGELKGYGNVELDEHHRLAPEDSTALVRAYHAATSFVDSQVQRVLTNLKESGLEEHTIVVLFGDHGWHLGEHGLWAKQTNFEVASRVPLIIRAPGFESGSCDALVELVDLFPTLVQLCGLPPIETLEGTSLSPLLKEPSLPWKSAVFCEYRRRGRLGSTIRTREHRFTEWAGKTPIFELYDRLEDPGEHRNLAEAPEHAELVQKLRKQLHAGWRAAGPPNQTPPAPLDKHE